jgi:hypothetical protein
MVRIYNKALFAWMVIVGAGVIALIISSQTFATFGSSGFNVLRDCFSQNEVISEGAR